MTLSGQQILTDLPYLIMGLLYPIRTNQRPLTNDIPTKWGNTPTAIQCFIWSHFDTSLITVVISKLYQRQVILLATLLGEDTRSQQVF